MVHGAATSYEPPENVWLAPPASAGPDRRTPENVPCTGAPASMPLAVSKIVQLEPGSFSEVNVMSAPASDDAKWR